MKRLPDVPTLDKATDMSAAEIAHALGGHRSGGGWIARCPAHEDRTPSLSLRDGDDGRVLLHCWAGCSFTDVRAELRARQLWPGDAPRLDAGERLRRKHEREAAEVAEKALRAAEALQLWQAARAIHPGDLPDRYLTDRLGPWPGPWPASLRFGAYTTSSTKRRYLALIAAACRWPDRVPVAIQATPLREPGVKRWNTPARVTRGDLMGAAVRLSPWSPGQPVIVVEGVEDGLAVLAAMPEATVWAAVGTGNAKNLVLPAGVEVTLMLDGDEAGRKATREAVPALWARGHRIRIASLPDDADPLDLLREARS